MDCLDALNGRGAAPLSRLTAVGVRGKFLDAWALREDGTLSHSWWPRADGEQTWSEPEDFAAPGATVDIAAASRGPGHAEIFAVDRTGNLWHRWSSLWGSITGSGLGSQPGWDHR